MEPQEEVPAEAGGAHTPPVRSTATPPRRTSPRGRVSTFQRARQANPPRLVRWKRSNVQVGSLERLTYINTQDVTTNNIHNVCSLGSKSPPDEYGGRGDQHHHQRSLGLSGGHHLCDHLDRIGESGKMGKKKGKILFFQIYLNNEKKYFSIASVPTLWYLLHLKLHQ